MTRFAIPPEPVILTKDPMTVVELEIDGRGPARAKLVQA